MRLDGNLCQYHATGDGTNDGPIWDRATIPLEYRRGLLPGPRRQQYPRVFVSYRRDDSEAYAGRLHQALVQRFGANEVFMDIFGILPGEPFRWTIQQAVTHADVVLAVIGPKWLNIRNDAGTRRLEIPDDLVLRELTAAMDRRTTIMPILVANAPYLEARNLPRELDGFDQLQALKSPPDIGRAMSRTW